MKKKRTKSLEIPMKVKKAVAKRDSFGGWTCCIFCGKPAPTENPLAFSNAHYIARSQGGLGIEENILTLCPECHRQYDNSEFRWAMMGVLRGHLKSKYTDWDETKLVYKKGECFDD